MNDTSHLTRQQLEDCYFAARDRADAAQPWVDLASELWVALVPPDIRAKNNQFFKTDPYCICGLIQNAVMDLQNNHAKEKETI